MLTLHATGDLKSYNWSVAANGDNTTPLIVSVNFTSAGSTNQLLGVKFGYEVRTNDLVVNYGMLPQPESRLISSDQSYLFTHELHNLKPLTPYTLWVWCEYKDARFEKAFDFEIEKPPKPFASWVWGNNAWVAPVKYPNDGLFYSWDEKSVSWVQVDPLLGSANNLDK